MRLSLLCRLQFELAVNWDLADICTLLLFQMLLVHFAAVLWHVAGVSRDEGLGVDGWALDEGYASGVPPERLYIKAVYWACVTVTTVGYGDFTPRTSAEYQLSMIVMFCGQLLFAQLFAVMAQYARNKSEADQQFLSHARQMALFCRARRLPTKLRRRVINYLALKWARTRGLNENAVLDSLPLNMGKDLKLELYQEILQKAPILAGAEPGLVPAMVHSFRLEVWAATIRIGRACTSCFTPSAAQAHASRCCTLANKSHAAVPPLPPAVLHSGRATRARWRSRQGPDLPAARIMHRTHR